jgi:hypothetical protein
MWAKTLEGVVQKGKRFIHQKKKKKLPRIQLCNMSLIDFLSKLHVTTQVLKP